MPGNYASQLFGQDHVRSYRETDGAVGHDWKGTTTLIRLQVCDEAECSDGE
jgi:hypothetical protein